MLHLGNPTRGMITMKFVHVDFGIVVPRSVIMKCGASVMVKGWACGLFFIFQESPLVGSRCGSNTWIPMDIHI